MVKMVINGDFGGFGYGVAEEFEDLVYQYQDDRFAPELVKFVEEHPEECGDLVIVGISEGFTDYHIEEYDGAESVLYVLDGKIHWAEELED
jgi:hypothetical protein